MLYLKEFEYLLIDLCWAMYIQFNGKFLLEKFERAKNIVRERRILKRPNAHLTPKLRRNSAISGGYSS